MMKSTSKSYFRFDNLNSYIKGVDEFTKLMDKWVETADLGYERTYNIVRDDESLSIELELTVSPHEQTDETN